MSGCFTGRMRGGTAPRNRLGGDAEAENTNHFLKRLRGMKGRNADIISGWIPMGVDASITVRIATHGLFWPFGDYGIQRSRVLRTLRRSGVKSGNCQRGPL